MGKYFGTDGFRGEANVTLTAEHAFAIGRFLGWHFGSKASVRVLIGKDTRRSGDMLEAALAGGLTASGADVFLLGVTTTPSIAYLVNAESFDCGIMISASHNPFYDNGIKLFNGAGEKMDEETIALLEAYLDGEQSSLEFATRGKIGTVTEYAEGRESYVEYLRELGLLPPEGIRIALDCANGSAYMLAKQVFHALGVKTYAINREPDGFNINRECGSTHIKTLQKFVLERQMDVGFAFDGDADRCLCVDEHGEAVTGDHILYVCGRYLKECGALRENTVVTTVMSNFGLYKAFDEIGVRYAKTAVGDKYVSEYMRKNGCCLGGEQSGHIIFGDCAATGDGILTCLKVLDVMRQKGQTLAQLTAPVTIYPQQLVNLKVKDKAAALSDPDVQQAIWSAQAQVGKSGRVLVRESGTEPLIRVMAEAPEAQTCRALTEGIVNVLKQKGHESV